MRDTNIVIIAILQRRKSRSDAQAASQGHPASKGNARMQPGLCDLKPPTSSTSLCGSLVLPLTPRGHGWAPPGRSQCRKEKELESQLDNDRPAPLCDPPPLPGWCLNFPHLSWRLWEAPALSADPPTTWAGAGAAGHPLDSNSLGSLREGSWTLRVEGTKILLP